VSGGGFTVRLTSDQMATIKVALGTDAATLRSMLRKLGTDEALEQQLRDVLELMEVLGNASTLHVQTYVPAASAARVQS
jgi:hypothetical protein